MGEVMQATKKDIREIANGPFRSEVIEGLPREEYFVSCGLNPSSLKQPSPKHVRHAYETVSEPTDAMKLGTAVHTLCWEPHKFSGEVVVFEGRRDPRANAWKDFLDEHDGKLILKPDQYERCTAIGVALTSDPLVKRLAEHGIAETAVFTIEHGLQCRGLLDWINTDLGILVDLKVVNSIEDRLFGAAVQRYGWDISMACYRRWFQRESGKEIREVKFIAVESKPPFDVVVVAVDEATLDAGWKKANDSVLRVKESIESGVWPGLGGGQEVPLYVPAYAMEEELVEFGE